MKTLFAVIFLLAFSATAFSQHSSVSKNIIVDDQIMTIKVDVEEAGRSLHYHRRFNVEGMSRDEQQALEDRILDSLGVNTPKKKKLVRDEPVAVAQRSHAGTTWEKPADVSTTSIQSATTNREQQGGLTAEVQSTPARPGTVVRIGGDKPYTKEINDDQETGRLFLRYRYTKDGEEYITSERLTPRVNQIKRNNASSAIRRKN